jgi:hypothetical protein
MKKREALWKSAKFGGGEIEVWFVGDPRGKAQLRVKLKVAGFVRRDTNTFTVGVVLSTVQAVKEYVTQAVRRTRGVTVWYRYIPVDILTMTQVVTKQEMET